MDPILCCAIGLCCPPNSPEQFDAVLALMEQHYKTDKKKAKQAALDAWPHFVEIAYRLHERKLEPGVDTGHGGPHD